MMTLKEAREQSQRQNDIVAIEWRSRHNNRDADAAMAQGYLGAEYDGEIDSAWENDGSLDIWGYQEDAPDGQMDWRLRISFVD